MIFHLTGFTGGSSAGHSGAAVEALCLPRNPEWGSYWDGVQGNKAYVYGAGSYMRKVHDHDVPCAVCLVHDRSVLRVFPGTIKVFSVY